MRPATQPERDGFSLIELTVAVAILGMVMAAIAAAIMVAMRVSSEAQQRLNQSGDLDLTSAYFLADVHGANTVAANNQPVSTGTAQPACGSTSATLVVQFQGEDFSELGTPVGTTVSYVLGDGGAQLVRRSCSGAAPGTVQEGVVASGLDAARAPVVTCRTSAESVVACASSGAMSVTLSTTGVDGSAHSVMGGRRTS